MGEGSTAANRFPSPQPSPPKGEGAGGAMALRAKPDRKMPAKSNSSVIGRRGSVGVVGFWSVAGPGPLPPDAGTVGQASSLSVLDRLEACPTFSFNRSTHSPFSFR
jgi:hypothetical protein